VSERVLVLVGTKKGLFILESDAARASWHVRGPLCEEWAIHDATYDPATGRLYAAGGDAWFGPAVWSSDDLGATWSHSSAGMTYGENGPRITTVWSIVPANGALYAGVEEAGLFRSVDGGATWEHVRGLTEHPSRPEWFGGAGGLILHTIVPHPTDPDRMWVAISAAGAFETRDGGATWMPRNRGLRNDFMPDPYPEIGHCVHKMVLAAGEDELLYQQYHGGVYRSADGGGTWEDIGTALPSGFGFAMAAHPRDRNAVYVVPLTDGVGRHMVDGRAAVWTTRDGGTTWRDLRAGLPQERAYVGVLREAMGTDPLDPAGVYFGTSTGQLFASADEGETWRLIADLLPPIWSVDTAVLRG
jgi:photosystem II stability/assembly factor-like uncharacterized protein